MSIAQEIGNKATLSRFEDAMNTGDVEVITKTIDEIVEPDVLIHMPWAIQATGARRRTVPGTEEISQLKPPRTRAWRAVGGANCS